MPGRLLPKRRPGQAAEDALSLHLRGLGIVHEREYVFCPTRRFRADVAIPEARLLVEVDGQVHSIRSKRERDMEKHNLAAFMGFAVLRYTPAQARDGTAALEVQRWLSRTDRGTP